MLLYAPLSLFSVVREHEEEKNSLLSEEKNSHICNHQDMLSFTKCNNFEECSPYSLMFSPEGEVGPPPNSLTLGS